MLTTEAVHRVLVVVDEACTSPSLGANVRAHAGGERLEVLVLSPAHGTATTEWYVDEDAARADATRRLRVCIGHLRGQGVEARGELADSDPVQGIGNALRLFPADEILIVTAPQRPSTWLQRGVIDRARRTFVQPIEHVVVPTTADRRTR